MLFLTQQIEHYIQKLFIKMSELFDLNRDKIDEDNQNEMVVYRSICYAFQMNNYDQTKICI